ncbi:biotin/lipoate--protein ligase family protein [Cognatiyoonia sp. IB215446]|uniref:biotin/lipoate--protein ligase family protein n=1 Tax=Cognatiyoonia sp. IB215446 TaxID=3097355 RepID=UPI002A16E2AD|nr:biotin/lipoate--protein ligase family protein [Cognatiyoonia sp. IB215446]MDX8348447.1 biotin/lipoate--protein ligase family protein [Cognatiyoonia sp. IB215446]
MTAPSFPPLMTGQATVDDPTDVAAQMAAVGCDAGTIVHNLGTDDLRAAMIFAPDIPLADAMIMLPICGIGFQNALGAIAPPEIAVLLEWDGTIRVNDAVCGALSVKSSSPQKDNVPDWLIVGLQVSIRNSTQNPGDTPDVTTLYEEGCGDLGAAQLLEGWARHTLVWINRWTDDGPRPIHAEYEGLLHRGDDEIGVDERFGLLRKSCETTTLTPLTALLEQA